MHRFILTRNKKRDYIIQSYAATHRNVIQSCVRAALFCFPFAVN